MYVCVYAVMIVCVYMCVCSDDCMCVQGQRRHVKSGGAKNGNIASAWELCWESIMKSIGKLMGGTL